MAKRIPHQITLTAFTRDTDGSLMVYDIVETSYRNASFFARSYIRDPMVVGISATSPRHARKQHGILRTLEGCRA